MNEVSKKPLRRSTTPLDSGSRGRSSTILVANTPANTPPARSACRGRCPVRCPRSACAAPDPTGSATPTNPVTNQCSCGSGSSARRRTANARQSSPKRATTPVNRLRGGSCGAGTTDHTEPHRQAINRSAGSIRGASARTRLTLSRNQRIDPVHPTRSASTVAGISGVSDSRLTHPRLERRERRRPRRPPILRRPSRRRP